ncbi:unnamed protein product [Urochloa humidicola]
MEAFLGRPLACLPFSAVTKDGTLSAAEGEADDGVDRISALPDDLRGRIVSCLPVKDAVRTTALSTRWRRVWHSTPLVLYDSHIDPDDPGRVAAVDRVLAGHSGPFATVHLALFFFDELERELRRWSRLLADRGVRDLALVSLLGPGDPVLLPVDILRCAELERLYLGCWRFPDTADLPDGAGVFPHLRELAMVYTSFEDRDLDRMLASSPVLETLALFVSFGITKRVRLRGQKLKCVLVWETAALELTVVDAPRLERLMWKTFALPEGVGSLMEVKIAGGASALKVLGYLELGAHKLQIGNRVIKADTNVSPRSMVPSIKILALKVNLGVFEEIQMLVNFLRCFPNVEVLHVESARAGEPTGNNYMDFFKELSPIECVQSHIKMRSPLNLSNTTLVMFVSRQSMGPTSCQNFRLSLPVGSSAS